MSAFVTIPSKLFRIDEGDPRLADHDPLSKLTCAAEGDVTAAHACASQFLAGAGSESAARDARLLLTAACLHLHTHGASSLTASDLVRFLGDQSVEAVLVSLHHTPSSLTEYAVIELGALTPTQLSLAFSMALGGVEDCLAVLSDNTA